MNPKLIEQFFAKQCTPQEAKKVADYLKQNPSVLEKYLSKDEWNSLAINNSLPQKVWDEIWLDIRQKNKAQVFKVSLKRFAAAASIIALVALIIYLIPSSQKPQPKQIAVVKQQPNFLHKTFLNNTNKTAAIKFDDGSVAELNPNSSIQYDSPFALIQRNIWLDGEAKFHAAKNKAKPFTVYAGTLATTALGTIFSVKKINLKNSVTVKLVEGKVVIHSMDKNLQGWKDDVYLLPGDEMKFDALLKTVTVKNLYVKKPDVLVAESKAGTDANSAELKFNNTKLPKVMDGLAIFYKVKINYDASLIDTMNFTGTVTPNDSLPVILKAIGLMNGLEVLKDSSGFSILKQLVPSVQEQQ